MVPRIRRHVRVEVVPGEAVYLVSERDFHVMEGDLAERVLPVLDGKHSEDDVIGELGDVAPERVLHLVDQLVERGVAVRADPATPVRDGAFWDLARITGETATQRLAAARVSLHVAGDADSAELRPLLRDAGVSIVDENPDLTIMLTEDYLHEELAAFNTARLADGRPWLLAKPVGSVLWIGPVFQPGQGGCWACLANRLAGHRQVEGYLRERLDLRGPLQVPLADVDSVRGVGARLVVAEIVKWCAGLRSRYQSDVFTLDALFLSAERHPLPHRPQCPACGDPGLVTAAASAPVTLTSQPKVYTGDGGHRAKHPDDVLRRYSSLVSPVTGVVKELRPFDVGADFVKGYVAGHNFARRVPHLKLLRVGLRSQSAGKGTTDTQAKASAICEAIERYSGLFTGDEPRRVDTLAALGEQAIAPNEVQRYSERQYAGRHAWNASLHSTFHLVCDPLPADAEIEWTPVWSLTEQRHRYLPTGYLYYHYPSERGKLYSWSDSNGNAAGSTREDAILQGFLELVERDSVAMWWYNRVRRPAFDLASFGDPWFDDFPVVYAGFNREVWVLDLTADLGIPTAAAISRRIDKPAEDILLAFGAHFDAKIAVQRALAELNQFLPSVARTKADGTGYGNPDHDQLRWWQSARLAEHPYLAPSAEPARGLGYHPDLSTVDLAEDVRTAQRLVESKGMQMLVLDHTRPDIELPVVKVIVPGMRHFWTRFGPGRLYDVPVALGWLTEPTPEDKLNPIPMFV
jgi:ribosomal protein S12 methylthiotransferase accessory factor